MLTFWGSITSGCDGCKKVGGRTGFLKQAGPATGEPGHYAQNVTIFIF